MKNIQNNNKRKENNKKNWFSNKFGSWQFFIVLTKAGNDQLFCFIDIKW